MAPYYNELLKLCGFDDDEITQQQARIESALNILELGSEDMENAVDRVKKQFDIELSGIRKILGIWLKELFDVVLAREEGKTIVYYGYPPFQYIGTVIKQAALNSDAEFWIGCPEVVFCETLGQIFGKLTPILEEGESKGLAPGHAMCSLLQIKNGALSKKMIPTPDLSIATSYFCDMGPKADELMQHLYGNYPVAYLDSCLDAPWGAWPNFDPEQARYLGKQLDQTFQTIKDLFGLELDGTVWREARLLALRFYAATAKLNQLLTSDPVPLGVADTQMIRSVSTGGTGVCLDEGAEAIEILVEEVEKRVEAGIGVVPKNAPRVLLDFNSLIDPVFNNLFTEVGLGVPMMRPFIPPIRIKESGQFTTLSEKRAEKSMHGGAYHSSYGAIQRMGENIKYTHIDGVILNYQFSCRPLVAYCKLLKQYMEKQTDLPMLLLDMDFYDDRNYSAAALRTRLEAFAEMLRAKKAAA